MSDWTIFKLLLWKNFIIQRRHKFQTFLEIIVPVIFASLLLVLRHLVTPEYHDGALKFDKFECDSIKGLRWAIFLVLSSNFWKNDPRQATSSHKIQWKIAYSPYNSILEGILNDSLKYIEGGEDLTIEGVQNARLLERHLVTNKIFVGVEFLDELQVWFCLVDPWSMPFPMQ